MIRLHVHEHDVDVRFTVRPLVDGVELVATYPDGSYDRGQGPSLVAAMHALWPKLGDGLAAIVTERTAP